LTASRYAISDTQPNRPAGPAAHLRLTATIDNWQKKLLDLSKRNRALNFRMNRVSTVAIVDEQPAQVFAQLSAGRSLRFKAAAATGPAKEVALPAEEPAGATPAPGLGVVIGDEAGTQARADVAADGWQQPARSELAASAGAPVEPGDDLGRPGGADLVVRPLADDASLDAPASLDFVPYDPAALEDRHTDDILQTASTPEQLDRSLRRIDEQARVTLEEQGVNALFLALGVLLYSDVPGASEVFRAPLVLVPVALSRRSARAGYTLRATDDDPLINPALAEHLRRVHGLILPDLPDADARGDDYDLQSFFGATAEAIGGQPGWAIKSEIYLGLFSFQKFVMYKDLEANAAAMARHRLVQQLVSRDGDGGAYSQLPEAVRNLDLDSDFAPENTFQVVDADSSQLRAIAAVAGGYDLVIEGPPGTGKSQTITNLIAQALSAGKSVLFVAEKMAALQVVYGRLVAAGLSEFCLELHSTKANKRAVMRELAASLDASLQRPVVPTQSTQRLPQVRQGLTEYARAVHQPHGALGLSPYQAYGHLGRVLDAERLPYTGRTADVTILELEQTLRDLDELSAAAGPIGVPAAHPWRDSTRTFYTEDDLDRVRSLASDLATRLTSLASRAARVAEAYGLRDLGGFAHVASAARLAAVIARSPGAPLAVLSSAEWNTPPPAALAIIERGRALARLKAHLAQRLRPEVFEQPHSQDAAYIEQKSSGVLAFLAFLDGRYRAIQARWRAYRLPGWQPSLLEQAAEMRRVDHCRSEQAALAAQTPEARQMFGGLWQGEASDWDGLERYVNWVAEFRAVCVQQRLDSRALEVAARPQPDVSPIEALQSEAEAAQAVLHDLARLLGWPSRVHEEAFTALTARATGLAESVALGPRWAAFETARARAAGGLAGEVLGPAMTGDIPCDHLRDAFARAFYQKWLAEVVQAREALRSFHSLTHEQRLAEFRELDRRVLLENQAALVAKLRERVQQQLRSGPAAAAMPFLRREMSRQRGLSPLRRTMQHAEAAIRAIKPCFMMSPLSVAQLLDGSQPGFDLVIFDEASQLPPEDAVGAIIRGSQLIVVGDPKQLPPTNFFSVMGGQVSALLGEDGLPLFDDGESVLEDYMGAGLPTCRLKWHYRSLHESLIAFSNVSFYEADLFTFPSVQTSADGRGVCGVCFEFVGNGVYEGGGVNMAEARRVADAVVEHARSTPELSLGVGTFNLRQQQAILDELEQRRRDDPALEPFFAHKEEGGFFVKNLENIQGDERDVIFISVTYARGSDGRLRFNFGPLNMQNGWRRLNVLATRARQQMRVFASIRGDDINVSQSDSAGARLLRSFLSYAEHGHVDGASPAAQAPTEGQALELDVADELEAHGLRLAQRVGLSGYRIDFGVLDDDVPGRYVAGVECDGPMYRGAETARDRDRLRQQVLEARGWRLLRLWSTDWYKDRAGQIERLLSQVAEAKEAALQAARAEVEAHAAWLVGIQDDATSDEALVEEAGEDDAGDETDSAYQRPQLAAYRAYSGERRYAGELLRAPAGQLQRAILRVLNAEAPLHIADLVTRVAGQWGTRAGNRIAARIADVCQATEEDGLLQRRGEFVWGPSGEFRARSRRGTGIPPERVPPEEYRAAILLVLGSGQGFDRPALNNEVRALLGYGRSNGALEAAVAVQLDSLLSEGLAGEGSTGITLRH
jgi:very-short-patch-repair endonuclease